MKKAFTITILMASALSYGAAQDSSLFPEGEIGKNTSNYTGTIWLSELNQPDSNFTFSLAQAVYAPGSKLDWHLHPGGQYLLITEGTGYYQERGKPKQTLLENNGADDVRFTKDELTGFNTDLAKIDIKGYVYHKWYSIFPVLKHHQKNNLKTT
jgi:hypothetical protein